MPRTRQPLEPPISVFWVRIVGGFYAPEDARSVWREIEIAANQTLADLGTAIPLAFGFDDPHLWSFFLSGRAWDRQSEYALHSEPDLFEEGPRPHAARRIAIRDVPLPGAAGKKEFLFLFDYGDEWYFGVKLVRLGLSVEVGVRYPRVVAQAGVAPPQYPNVEDEDEEDDLIPADHFYRHLDRVLDLSFVRELVQNCYAPGGRPSIDPVIFFKLQLVMFLARHSLRTSPPAPGRRPAECAVVYRLPFGRIFARPLELDAHP